MTALVYILISTILVSLLSFAGVLVLYLREKILNSLLLVLVAFSAGVLIGSAFLHLLPEAIRQTASDESSLLKLFLFLLLGFCSVFVLEQFVGWHHHHTKEHPEMESGHNHSSSQDSELRPFSYSILISDGIHNFIDGLVIAGSFMTAIPVGIATSFAVIFHEIPHEFGNFGLLVYCGFTRAKALFYNFLSALSAILGGLAGFFLSEKIGISTVFLLPFAAGNFIYIAASDLIPEIKEKLNLKKSLTYFVIFLAGIGLMLASKLLFNE